MEHAWLCTKMNGICTEHAWNMYGMCMEYEWNMHGILMEHVWNIWNRYGTCMEHACEACMGHAWNLHGVCVESVEFAYPVLRLASLRAPWPSLSLPGVSFVCRFYTQRFSTNFGKRPYEVSLRICMV